MCATSPDLKYVIEFCCNSVRNLNRSPVCLPGEPLSLEPNLSQEKSWDCDDSGVCYCQNMRSPGAQPRKPDRIVEEAVPSNRENIKVARALSNLSRGESVD